MTRPTSVIDNCIRLNKIRGKMSQNEKKGTRREAYSAQTVVRRSPPCRTGNEGLEYLFHCINPCPVPDDHVFKQLIQDLTNILKTPCILFCGLLIFFKINFFKKLSRNLYKVICTVCLVGTSQYIIDCQFSGVCMRKIVYYLLH